MATSSMHMLMGSPVHVAPACARSGEWSDHFGSYVHNISLHFCKSCFQELVVKIIVAYGVKFVRPYRAILNINCIIFLIHFMPHDDT
jgi:hypothetical protein